MSIREGNGRDGDGRNCDGWSEEEKERGGGIYANRRKSNEKDGIEGD